MHLRLGLLTAAIVSSLAFVGSGSAITGNPVPTGDTYNYVVNLAFYNSGVRAQERPQVAPVPRLRTIFEGNSNRETTLRTPG